MTKLEKINYSIKIQNEPAKKEVQAKIWFANASRKVQDLTFAAFSEIKSFVQANKTAIAWTAGIGTLAAVTYGIYSHYGVQPPVPLPVDNGTCDVDPSYFKIIKDTCPVTPPKTCPIDFQPVLRTVTKYGNCSLAG